MAVLMTTQHAKLETAGPPLAVQLRALAVGLDSQPCSILPCEDNSCLGPSSEDCELCSFFPRKPGNLESRRQRAALRCIFMLEGVATLGDVPRRDKSPQSARAKVDLHPRETRTRPSHQALLFCACTCSSPPHRKQRAQRRASYTTSQSSAASSSALQTTTTLSPAKRNL
ncbi:hypothetical protein P171DRAFT_102515 [Karstenula rhodostoma CBS 690.94]|uniref:Uncharacterized protein n=1 Tax=Karstenula rhodostoma CBS 690.94 TaxID=1392251 RepID=A0A9P4PAL8_9PLEO|nr:hypothetical protein P171DRAFT_102515 [Karstenula rhodostoma CBS 690.94]